MSRDSQFRRPRPEDWAIFEALETLSPPSSSPSLTESALEALSSSGEIPILLQTHSSSDITESLRFEELRLNCPASLVVPSISTATVESNATFGPKVKISGTRLVRPLDSSDSIASALRACTYPAMSVAMPDSASLSVMDLRGYYDHVYSDPSEFTLSAYLPSASVHQGLVSLRPSVSAPSTRVMFAQTSSIGSLPTSPTSSAFPSPVQSMTFRPIPHGPAIPEAARDSISLSPSWQSSRSYSVSSTAIARSPALSPSDSSLMDGDELLTRARCKRGASRDAARYRQEPSLSDSDPYVRSDSPLPTECGNGGWASLRARSHNTAMQTANSARSLQSLRSSRPSSPLASPNHQPCILPSILGWLQDIVIELWIDQEGFRAVRPQFVPTGFSPPAHGSESGVPQLVDGTVEFRPRRRDTFIFHYGILDTPPGLRRLMIAGDDSKDYISRQASLSVRSNGIYVVYGSEHFSTSVLHPEDFPQRCQESSKVTWRFEYLVDDRRADTTGKLMPGEKTLMPLTFSCSPGLLHPTHGKKIRLMQVFKKSMTPKLSSEKVETCQLYRPQDPPKCAGSTSGGFRPVEVASGTVDAGLESIGHRRTASSETLDVVSVSPTQLSPNHTPPRGHIIPRTTPLQFGHILPPSELARLMISSPAPEGAGFHSLPAPKHLGRTKSST